jgi:CARDB
MNGRTIRRSRTLALAALALTGVVVSEAAAASARRLPDLRVTAASATPSALPGGPIVVSYTVANRGRRAARRARIGFFLSRDAVRDRRDVALRDARLRGLRRGKRRRGTARLVLPAAGVPAGARVLVCADHRRRVRESNERNNCRATRPLATAAPAPPGGVPGVPPAPPVEPAPAADPPAATPEPPTDPAQWSDGDSPGTVTVEGVSATTFNPLASQVRFVLTGAQFDADSDYVDVSLNGTDVAAAKVMVDPGQIAFTGPLAVGRNAVKLFALDQEGLVVESEIVVWAGDRTLHVNAVDAEADPVPGAEVTLTLGDDNTVSAEATANASGGADFENLPDRTVLMHGTGPGDLSGVSGTTGGAGTASLVLYGFNPASTIDNNDFSQGLAGWDVGSAPVTLVEHQPEEGETRRRRRAEEPDMDLRLSTSGEGQQHISRTFTVEEDVEAVAVRYRFITSEVPGGYYGTKYNDYFSVNVRSQSANGNSVEANSMNGLGLGQFTAGGATAWREEELELDGADTVQVDLSVANVADGAYGSQVEVAIVAKKKIAITDMSLRDVEVIYDGVAVSDPLQYLSIGPHTYFGGYTRVWGTIRIKGAAADKLTELELEVIVGGQIKARGLLTAALKPVLYQSFGSDGVLEVTVNQHLFSLPSADTTDIDQATNGGVLLRVRAESEKEPDGATKEHPGYPHRLVSHNAGRYKDNDFNRAEGGDSWVKPTVKPIVESFTSVEWGDASNMNGAQIEPHAEHRTGNDVDGWFTGYNDRGAEDANRMVELLNAAHDRGYVKRVERVLVTYAVAASDPFYAAIAEVELKDGRNAIDVIVPASDHADHFHWDITDRSP